MKLRTFPEERKVNDFNMGSEKIHIIYTAEDIQKYFSGRLTPAEMHAIEKAALEDDLLAEAMEGYEGMQEKEWESQLTLLKNNFSPIRPAKVIALKSSSRYSWWKVAAALLLLGGGVAITYRLSYKQSPENKSIAIISSKYDSVNSHVTEANSIDTTTKKTAVFPQKTNAKIPEKLLASGKDQKPVTDNSFIYRPGTIDKQVIQDTGGGYMSDNVKSSMDLSTSNAVPSLQSNTLQQSEIKSNEITIQSAMSNIKALKREAGTTRNFTAQVVAPDGTPLPFAHINITGENSGTYADAKGNISLVFPDSLVNIQIKSVGYISRNFSLKSNAPQSKIVLAEDELALKDNTIFIGKQSKIAKKRTAAMEADSISDAEPADGWINYDTYISNNLSLTNDILQKNIHGEVQVSFEVKSNGAISNMKVDKSLCDDCDEAAIKVIKDGPRWKVKPGSKGTAKVKVKF